jgi:predicted nucleic acid-binding protein
MNAGRTFFDTNVLLYMHSAADPRKQARAQEIFDEFTSSGRILLSTQVVQEFFSAGSRKLALPHRALRQVTASFLELPLVHIGGPHILRAMDTMEQYGISFWDALILAAAESGGAGILFTEDLNHGQQYGKVMVQNPFRPAS